MAVLSFAHLKNKKPPEIELPQATSPSGPYPAVRIYTKPAGGVMSFAHLKAAKKEQPVITTIITPDAIPEEKTQSPRRSTFRIPSVMPTALLHAVNYCRGCGRFIPAEEWENERGNKYGRCLREDGPKGEEIWRVIPAEAPVSRCYFMMRDKR